MRGKDILCERAETVYNIYAAQTPLSLIVEIEQVKQKGLGGVDMDKALQRQRQRQDFCL